MYIYNVHFCLTFLLDICHFPCLIFYGHKLLLLAACNCFIFEYLIFLHVCCVQIITFLTAISKAGSGGNPRPEFDPVQTFSIEGYLVKREHIESAHLICDSVKWNEWQCGAHNVSVLGKTIFFGIAAYLVVFLFLFLYYWPSRGPGCRCRKYSVCLPRESDSFIFLLLTDLVGGCRPGVETVA